jgi:hypothetical protein
MKKKLVASWIKQYDIDGIISDNRLGVLIKCTVFITHQLNVMTGNTTWLTSKLHQNIIKNIQNAGFLMFRPQPSGRRIKPFEQLILYT